ncbi:MAG: lytic transglycosylase domain-containing protein [Alphaproteobacteria bacterium]|nr:lytic transglycosylase domain-containing protein [Alphaproteobacteria bacterium]
MLKSKTLQGVHAPLRSLFALSLLVLTFLGLIMVPGLETRAAAGEHPPLPVPRPGESLKSRVVQYSLSDITKAGKAPLQVPVPRVRPSALTGGAPDLVSPQSVSTQARQAAKHLYGGEVKAASDLAARIADHADSPVPLAGWVAGLAAWMEQDYSAAARYFELAAAEPGPEGAAGAYWAARAHKRAGHAPEVSTWLLRAARHPRTFYGLLAARALGRDIPFNWNIPAFTEADRFILEQIPVAKQAMDMAQAGQVWTAQADLLRLQPADEETRLALLAFASQEKIPAVALQVGTLLSANGQETYYDGALYPDTPWEPTSGFSIDSALLQAIVRRESRFNPQARSAQGAAGLMQLLPSTARHVAQAYGMTLGQDSLNDPAINMDLGQKYLGDLLEDSAVDGDLMSLLIAYNAGPGNLLKWKKKWENVDDSLLFIELIPLAETRGYVEEVLASYWIYRLRHGKPTPTLTALAEGMPARYALAGGADPYALASSR